jgi:hypothetical protein
VTRTGRVASVGAFLLALAATAAACNGRTIHLGNGRTDGGPCVHAQVSAAEVLWIGDSWVLVTGTQHTRVRDLARAAGAIGPNDDYVISAAPAATMAAVANQYAAREAGATRVKVVIMDGGTWDTLVAGGSDASVASVVATFGQFLDQVAADGTVEHIIYFLTPEMPGIPGVAALRPQLQQACAQSSVPCDFIDLTPIWSGHAEYTMSDTGVPVPTEAGATAIADAIWSVMQQRCVAQ